MKNRLLILIISVVFAVCTLFAGCSSEESETTTNTPATNVSVYKTDKSSICNATIYSGTISSEKNVVVSAKVSAKAIDVNVKAGEYVKAGQKLISLDKSDLTNAYNQALSAYNSALANQKSVLNSSIKQSSVQASQALKSAQIAYDQAKVNYDREKKLFDNASNVKLAQQNYDTAKANYEREQALYNNASNVKLAQQNYDTAKSNYEREKQLFDNASALKMSQQNYDDAKAAYDRVKQLFDIGGVSQVELDSAQSAMISAEENLKTTKVTSSAALDAARTQMISAEENLKTVQATESAALEAAKSQFISAEENLKVTKLTESASLDAAKSALDNAQNALTNAKENIGLIDIANKSAKETAQASVDSAKVSLNIASDNLKNTNITAPISGYVARIAISEGQVVSPGIELLSITNTNVVNAEVNVTETNIPYLEAGSIAYISVAAANLSHVEASVSEINPIKDSRTGLYNVKVSIDNKDGNIKVGMICDVELILAEKSDIVKIPSKSLINSGDEYYVFVSNGKKAEKRKVTVGISDDEFTEITEGIDFGEDVIVEGKDYLSEKNNDIRITGEYEGKITDSSTKSSESDASEQLIEQEKRVRRTALRAEE